MLQKDKTMIGVIGVRKCVSETAAWEKLEEESGEESGREWGWKELEWLDEFIGRLDYEAIRSGDL